jgi:glycogen phosphorylase
MIALLGQRPHHLENDPIMTQERTIHQKLSELAGNLWWSWQPEVTSIFREIDSQLWTDVSHNPILLLREYHSEKLELRVRESVLHARIHGAYRRWQEYMHSDQTWGDTHAAVLGHRPAAYFSAEFGIHESLRVYSGGLGVLAGDHLKSASDLGIPLVAIGLFYEEGYFKQTVSPAGWQEETYPHSDPQDLPMRVALDTEGKPIVVSVQTRSETIHARVWRVDVGRIALYLMDTNVPQNTEATQRLTSRLYGGDEKIRIRQEMVLGVGGMKALIAMGIWPRVIHMNEGHSAFAPLEMIRRRMKDDGLSFDDALRETATIGVFTTHTPVAAGPSDHSEKFCMTVLAFNASRRANAVSNLHGVVSRKMWRCLWPWRKEEEVPIGHITNGVHVSTWLAPQMRFLYDRVLPLDWYLKSGEPEVWKGIDDITDGELWETHESLKNRLIGYARYRLTKQAERHKVSDKEMERIQTILDPQALLIGFARRFAPYKRADLIMRDLDLLAEIIRHSDRPVQFIFAGKAHPADDPGKQILQRIHKIAHDERFLGRIVFLEDYDINLARHLVQGVDVWLNNPRRPLEASGTSGQKVVLNGGLNLSISDGWWAEAYDGRNGFMIENGLIHSDQGIQDGRDGDDLLRVVQKEVIPLYYECDEDGLPHNWIKRMKRSMKTLGWRYNADRMVMDYVSKAYIPASGSTSSALPYVP